MKLPQIWHPFLISLLAILATFATNVEQLSLYELLIPLGLTLGLTGCLWPLVGWLVKDSAKAALAVSLFLLCFFTVGHVAAGLSRAGVGGTVYTRFALVVLVETVVLALVLRVIWRKPALVPGLTHYFNTFSLIAICLPLGMILFKEGTWLIQSEAAPNGIEEGYGEVVATSARPGRLPDIYYIIPDAYGRSDVLKEIFDYDNEAFLDRLEKKGFFVARRSTSNYTQTVLSLSSSLNFKYHEGLANSNLPRSVLYPAIRHNAVINTLKEHGYHFVSYASGCIETDFPDVDVYLSPVMRVSPFHALLLEGTPLRLLGGEHGFRNPYQLHRARTLYVFDNLGQIARQHSPKFVLAHVIGPHPPFLFGKNGEDTSPYHLRYDLADGSFYRRWAQGKTIDYVEGYRGQVAFITKMVERAIDQILANSPEPPVIIVQGDHGPGSRWEADRGELVNTMDTGERMTILNAYYLPDGGDKELYPEISPVNSFRVVLNHYFGTKLKLLKDVNYFSTVQDPFVFTDVSKRVQAPRTPPGTKKLPSHDPEVHSRATGR